MKIIKRVGFRKRGVSPLIATVLLIGFTVALAGVVITWGGGFVERLQAGTDERTDISIACTGDLRFQITKVACPDLVIIENKGVLEIISIKLRFFDNSDEITGEAQTLSGINKNDLKKYNLDNPFPPGTSKISAIATISVKDQEVSCGDVAKVKIFTPCTGGSSSSDSFDEDFF